MSNTKCFVQLFALVLIKCVVSHPHLYNPYHRYPDFVPYADQISSYSPFIPPYHPNFIPASTINPSSSNFDFLPTLNVLAEIPYSITNRFTVVSMYVMAKENMNMISSAHIMQVSKSKPVMTIKTEEDNLVQCTPAVKIILERPMTVFSLKTSVLFPSEIEIIHEGFRIPIVIGAIIAPVRHDAYVSVDTPISLNVVYAIPTKPITIDYVNNNDVIDVPETQAVIVETANFLPPKNVTVIDFPEKEAEPVLEIDEDDDELVNRNPPILLAPGGIVQSTQPINRVEPFQNSKESSVLVSLREEAKKRF